MADPKYISQITLPDNETYNLKDSAAARVSHTHGNLTNDGKITSTATIASGDKLVIVDSDSTAGSKITGSSITFGTSTAQWLNNSGKWSTPSAAQVGAATTNHTHTLSLATDTGTSSTTLAHGGKYKLTAGGNSVIFTLPSDNNTTYTISSGTNNGQITVTPSSGDAYNVSVTGLGSAAYTSAGAYASSGHTHTTTIADAASGDTNQKTLAFGGKYKLTAGGTNYIFTMPSNPNTNTTYTIASGDSSGQIKVTPSVGDAYNVTVKDINAAAYKGITDNSSNTDVTSTDTNLITGRTLYYQLAKKGYTTNTGTVTSITLKAGSGITLDVNNTPITTSGTRTIGIATSGVTNAMLAGSIDNSKLSNSTITIGGNSVALGGSISLADLGLDSAMHYRGTVAAIPPASGTYVSGDVVVLSGTVKEYVYDGTNWRELGTEGSYKIKQTAYSDSTGTSESTTATRFVYSISQTADGAVSFKTRPLPTYNNYSHPTGDGNLHVPATGTSNNGKFLKAGSTAGSLSWGTAVTSVGTGVGLTGGSITTTGTIKAKLRSETALTNDSAAATEVSNRVYPVAVDKSGYLAVNVPWTNVNGSYLPLSGGTLTGNTYHNSSTGDKKFYFTRLGTANESTGVWVDDSYTYFDVTNDETAANVKFNLTATDTEGSDGSHSSISSVIFNGANNKSTIIADYFYGLATNATTATNLAAAPSFSSGGSNPTAFGANTTYTLTVGGQSVVFKTPTDNDSKVTQSSSTSTNWRKILLHYKDDAASTTAVTSSTNQIYAAVGVSVQPSTGTIRADKYNIFDKATLQWNPALSAVEFIFA